MYVYIVAILVLQCSCYTSIHTISYMYVVVLVLFNKKLEVATITIHLLLPCCVASRPQTTRQLDN